MPRYDIRSYLPQAELNQLELQFLLLNDFALVIPPEELARYAAQLIAYGQSRGIALKPEGVGKGKLGREAKIVLGLQPEPTPEPINDANGPLPSPPPSTSYHNGFGGAMTPSAKVYGMGRSGVNEPAAVNGSTYGGASRVAYPTGTTYLHDNRSQSDSMEISHDSETEASTDEDSTIKARSGSESEASEWGVGSTGDEGEGEGVETETEGEEELNHHHFHDRHIRRPTSTSGGPRSRTGRIRGVPSASMEGRRL